MMSKSFVFIEGERSFVTCECQVVDQLAEPLVPVLLLLTDYGSQLSTTTITTTSSTQHISVPLLPTNYGPQLNTTTTTTTHRTQHISVPLLQTNYGPQPSTTTTTTTHRTQTSVCQFPSF